MSTIKSSTEHLTLNADGSGKDIKFQANGVEKASIDSSGNFTSTSIDATKLSGALPAIDGSALTSLTSSQMPAGSVLQVVRGETSADTRGTGDFDVVAATITPIQTNSNILISVYTQYNTMSQGAEWGLVLKRGTTKILGESQRDYFISGGGVDTGAFAGTQKSLSFAANYVSKTDLDTTRTAGTTAITYTIRKEQGNGSCDVRFIYDGWGGNGVESNRSKAVIILTEVAQ